MRHILLGTLTIVTIALGAATAMAQNPPPPVPGGSGSQTTNPSIYRDTAKRDRERSMLLQQKQLGMTTGSVSKHHTTKKHHRTTRPGM
ncbi:hypothetical protein P7L87_25770 [Vibrio parahaemolyticus]|uniref:Uncharacterized protein n=1 Tax=Microvirga mediterraneensis TaxID=2754695 RepID=A0A838BPC2_9HYPH|nr:hypothetical protein [Microvirga mediterraneensis]MBA1156875.1 hypothetical protein [Microvirga mediterraneensis]MDG2570965.1 hypothetical protein [Vibrio parahaemolyticus]